MRPVRKVLAVAILGLVLLTGCGRETTSQTSGSAGGATSSTAAFPVRIKAGNGEVTITKRPERIISLSPTATETLYAIGAGAQVVAVDNQSDYPAEAPKTDLSGFKPNVEAIVAHKPDLVVVSNDIDQIVGELTKLGVPVLVEPAVTELEQAYTEIEDLGAATGNAERAKQTVSTMKSELERLAADAPKRKLTYYHEIDPTPYAATSTTFIGRIYHLFGLENIADKAPASAGGYPKLSAEFVAQADPDLIFLADAQEGGESKETLARRPGWKNLSAIKNDRVVELDSDTASRWGPRVVDLAKRIAAALSKAA